MQLWWFSSSSAMPFLDFASVHLAPLTQRVVDVFRHVQPDIWWTFAYFSVFGFTYLFHAPFRSHSNVQYDTYAQITKILQTWCTLVIMCFHLGPKFAQSKNLMMKRHISSEDTVATVFFPVLFLFSAEFLFIHKMKRRWRLGVTYGPTLYVILLNSIGIAVLATAHYAYCDYLYNAPHSKLMEWLKPLVAPASIVTHPFAAIAKLFFLFNLFIAADYQYKKLFGFDPLRGILWSQLYDLKKDNMTQAAQQNKHVDWREAEAPPRIVGAKHKSVKQKGAAPADHTYHDSQFSTFELLMRGVSLSNRVEYSSDSEDQESVTLSVSSPNSADGLPEGATPTAKVTRVSFAAPKAEVAELKAAKHPVNRPGMVPWWSTFAFQTAWQAFAEVSLGFLSFDFRTIQDTVTPKVFSLAFAAKLTPSAFASAARRSSVEDLSAASPVIDAQEEPDAAHLTDCSSAPPSSKAADTECDVWFDWIADIGDGFNPTYELARLLAQPSLQLEDSGALSKKEKEERQRANAVTRAARRSGRALRSVATRVSRTADDSNKQQSGRRSHSIPTREKPVLQFPSTSSPSASATDCAVLGKSVDAQQLRAVRKQRSASAESRGRPPMKREEASQRASLTLPRASFVVVGGDLAYPSPNDDTYTNRLFEPYNDAFGGNTKLRKCFHRHRGEIVQLDPEDKDLAHITMMNAEYVANVASGGDPLRATRGTVEEALRTTPMLFAIPGNHDWFDGLTTFRKYMIEKTWIGGWLMPQRSSYFVLRLPYNWFIICGDTGNTADINAAQRNYFLDVIEKYMDDESCVILTCHEPGWIYDAMLRRTSPTQPELNRVVRHLGTRLRIRLAGDIHNYSRHTPADPLSDAAMLVVSGGGGAFLHGSRKDKIISQGTHYRRNEAFPRSNTYMSMASQLVGFRLINWKFDVIIGVLCFHLIFSLLPIPVNRPEFGEMTTLSGLYMQWLGAAADLTLYLFSSGVASLFPLAFYWACFSSAGADRKAPAWWRLMYGFFWTFCVVVASCSMLSLLMTMLKYMGLTGMLESVDGKWGSLMAEQTLASLDALVNHTRDNLGSRSPMSKSLNTMQQRLYGSTAAKMYGFLVSSLDPVETLAYLSDKVSSDRIGQFAPDTTRFEAIMYYLYLLFFFWVLVTPVVSFLIGFFLLVSVTAFDYMYDGAYSAFQIEDFKHFVRFRIDCKTRELHAYVIGEKKVPRVWTSNQRHVEEFDDREKSVLPPHLRQHPSRWSPSARRGKTISKVQLLEQFTVRPHRTSSESKDAAAPLESD